jgi:uncharacterized membrane protein
MINLHPPLASFLAPTCLIVVILEIVAIANKTKYSIINWLLFSCAIIATCTFISGYFASYTASQTFKVPEKVIAYHYNIGRITLILTWFTALLSLFIVNLKIRILYLIILMATLISIFYSGYLGGELVFNYGAGVVVEKTR